MTAVNCRAKLLSVEGDEEEFEHLIGVMGHLHLSNNNNNYFLPENSGEILSLLRKEVSKKDSKIEVVTKLNNVFIFKIMTSKD